MRAARLAHRLLAAVMLGVGTGFTPKARPGDHWSTAPNAPVEVDRAEVDDATAGGGEG